MKDFQTFLKESTTDMERSPYLFNTSELEPGDYIVDYSGNKIKIGKVVANTNKEEVSIEFEDGSKNTSYKSGYLTNDKSSVETEKQYRIKQNPYKKPRFLQISKKLYNQLLSDIPDDVTKLYQLLKKD